VAGELMEPPAPRDGTSWPGIRWPPRARSTSRRSGPG